MVGMIDGVKLLLVLKSKVEFPCHFVEALSQKIPGLNGAVPVPRVNSSLLCSVGFVVSVVYELTLPGFKICERSS